MSVVTGGWGFGPVVTWGWGGGVPAEVIAGACHAVVICPEPAGAAPISAEAVVQAFLKAEPQAAVAVALESARFVEVFDLSGAFAVVEIPDGEIRSFIAIRPEAAASLAVALEAARGVATEPEAASGAVVSAEPGRSVIVRREGSTIIIWPLPCSGDRDDG